MSLIMGLPPGSALHRAVDPAGSSWGNTEELLSSLIEIVDHGNRMFFASKTKAGTPLPKPVKIIRPGEQPIESDGTEAKTPKQSGPLDIKRFAGSHLKVVPKES